MEGLAGFGGVDSMGCCSFRAFNNLKCYTLAADRLSSLCVFVTLSLVTLSLVTLSLVTKVFTTD